MPNFNTFTEVEIDEYIWSNGEMLPYHEHTQIEVLGNNLFFIGERVTQSVTSACGQVLWQDNNIIGIGKTDLEFDCIHEITGNDSGKIALPCDMVVLER
jgi:hypothetical protein